MGKHFAALSALLISVSAPAFDIVPNPSSNEVVWSGSDRTSWCAVCPQAPDGKSNVWVAWRSDVDLSELPSDATLNISCDSKYWLWVNGKPVIFEGCLKRGPNRTDSYYDTVDLKPFLVEGRNRIAVLQWYFGKSGFSHNDSGKAAMWMESGFLPYDSWVCRVLPAYQDTDEPLPNYRLPESNIRYDERLSIGDWQTDPELEGFVRPESLSGRPLGKMYPRPLPQWKDFGLKYVGWEVKHGIDCDTLSVKLPYNMQLTPLITVRDTEGGTCLKLETDHAYHGRANCIRAEYITAPGTHSYESLGWMNGEELRVIVPHGSAAVTQFGYRETGYDVEFAGSFKCDDPFFMEFWRKAERTLYVNMRDNFFDCPDRERAQWWGDIVTLQGEAFYTCSRSVDALIEKGIRQLCEYQRPDGTIFSPIPGKYDSELPAQMLSSVGRYGFWTYYLNTGDRATLEFAYPYVRRYLDVWKLDGSGLTEFRKGGWSWGDWGKNIDLRLILAAWHYMALDGARLMALELGCKRDAKAFQSTMNKIRKAYNKCWDGRVYRHPDYRNLTDDRVQALAVVAGIAPKKWWPEIAAALKVTEHASPYLEKYVMEALFIMGRGECSISIPTVKGEVSSSWVSDGSSWTVTVPEGTQAVIRNPWTGKVTTKGPGCWKL